MKKTVKAITINSTRFVLPEGMPAKDVQALAGFLCTLTQLEDNYNYDTSEYMYSLGEGVRLQVTDLQVLDKDEARKLSDESRERYHAKREAEKAAA